MLHPKNKLPINMGLHHSIFTGRILPVGVLEPPPNGLPKLVLKAHPDGCAYLYW